MNIYKKLKLMRKINGYTQQEIADKLLISRQAVQKWECGETTPDISRLKEISIIFNLSLDDLLDPHIDDIMLRNKVINGDNNLCYNSHNKLVSLINQPTRIDYVVVAIVTFSTSLFLVLLHLLGIIFVILTIVFAVSSLSLWIYFLLNNYYNISNGIPSTLINIGTSMFSFSLSIYIYHYFLVMLNTYIHMIMILTNRIKDYNIIRRGINDARKS